MALVTAIGLLAALLGGTLAAAEPSEIQNEVVEIGLEEAADGDDALCSEVTPLARGGGSPLAVASRRDRSSLYGRAPGARGPPAFS